MPSHFDVYDKDTSSEGEGEYQPTQSKQPMTLYEKMKTLPVPEESCDSDDSFNSDTFFGHEEEDEEDIVDCQQIKTFQQAFQECSLFIDGFIQNKSKRKNKHSQQDIQSQVLEIYNHITDCGSKTKCLEKYIHHIMRKLYIMNRSHKMRICDLVMMNVITFYNPGLYIGMTLLFAGGVSSGPTSSKNDKIDYALQLFSFMYDRLVGDVPT